MSRATYMQRAFDILRASPHLLTERDLARAMGVDEAVASSAIERLRRLRMTTSVCQDGTWRYGIKPSAERPGDERGRPARRRVSA